MKIKTYTGKVLDTDKMADKDAEVHEALNNLFEVCRKYNISMFARVLLSPKQNLEAQYILKAKEGEREKDILVMLSLIGMFVKRLTGGKVQLVRIKE